MKGPKERELDALDCTRDSTDTVYTSMLLIAIL